MASPILENMRSPKEVAWLDRALKPLQAMELKPSSLRARVVEHSMK